MRANVIDAHLFFFFFLPASCTRCAANADVLAVVHTCGTNTCIATDLSTREVDRAAEARQRSSSA